MTDGLIAGRFRITGLLGSGGTAAVFDAIDTDSADRRIALKLLHPHLAEDRGAWDAFLEEVRAAQSLVHPLIAEVFDAGFVDVDPPAVWISMERVDGVTLEEHVRREGPLSNEAAWVLADGLLDALAAAHTAGVVHRDITPANVMLDAATVQPFDRGAFGASIRLLDFGLADVPGRATLGATALLTNADADDAGVVASVPFASPEQLMGAAVTESSDVYQVGATLFFALTGRAPFTGAPDAVARAHVSAAPPIASASRRGVDRQFDRIVTTALLKAPADRYRDASAMLAAVRAATLSALSGSVTEVHAAPAMTVVPDADSATRTLVYRTSVPLTGNVAAAAPLIDTEPRSRWPLWAAACVGVLVIVGIVGWSAVAGSAPSAIPTARPSTSLVPTPTPTSTPEPTEALATTAQIPDMLGQTLAEASAALLAHGFVIGDIVRIDGTTALDTVLAADPGVGAHIALGTPVRLEVASGQNAVPALVGLTLTEALARLANAGLVGHVQTVPSGTPGMVASAEPAAGNVLSLGSEVVIRVAETPQQPTSAPTPAPTQTPTVPTPSPTGTPDAVDE